MTRGLHVIALLACVCVVGACQPYGVCVTPARVATMPRRLSSTGLWTAVATQTLAPGVRAYQPEFALWADGADKRRWIWLPPGTRIDTRDMDSWRFPQGTKFWKEFAVAGHRVETRLLEKIGASDDDWVGVAYVWNAAQTDAVITPLGQVHASGTSHYVPSAAECIACHGGRSGRVLGFSAIQLSHDAAAGELALDEVTSEGLLSHPPAGRFVVPGSATEREALGNLHANCGHCHNSARPVKPCFNPRSDLDLWLRVDALVTPAATPTYRSALGRFIRPGNADGSELLGRTRSGGLFTHRMPPLATDAVDMRAVALLRTWISRMRP